MALKLYVWEGVLTDYSSGIAFALAHNVKEARKLVLQAWVNPDDKVFQKELQAKPKVHRAPAGYAQSGGG
jgi:hypothetical protein